MTAPKWEPAKLYPPGSLVTPRTAPMAVLPPIPNPGFEDGMTGWTGTPDVDSFTWNPYTGSRACRIQGGSGTSYVVSAKVAASPGMSITASAMYNQGRPKGGNEGAVILRWYDTAGAVIREDAGALVLDTKTDNYVRASVTATAPAGTTHVAVGGKSIRNDTRGSQFDDFVWALNAGSPAPSGLMYKATQAAAGFSAAEEPTWPSAVGIPVTDNEVVWEGVLASRIVWEAEPILVSGATEPTWPDLIGASVADNTISWTAVDPQADDANCPQSKIVAIAKFKVFAGDGDVVRYTATLNPKDWSSEKDAGYLGTGLQQNGANHVALLNLYRANLVVMNATTFQQWQIDPDPSLMDLLDTMDGIGSIWHLAAQPVSNDLFYLSNRGVRTIGMSGTTNNLKAGDVGLPVDEMVRALVSELVETNRSYGNENLQPLGLYLPSMGQYWLAFNRKTKGDESDTAPGGPVDVCPQLRGGPESEGGDAYCEVMVYTLTQVGQVGAWSRYIFPFPIDAWAQEGDDLYARDGNTVYRISEDIGCRDRWNGVDEGEGYWERFDAIIQWPWLDMGPPGIDKQMEDFDVVGYGGVEVEVGYDQTEPGYFTEPYPVVADTLRGTTVPMPLTSPSYSVRLRYRGMGYDDDDGGGESFAPPPSRVYNMTWGFNAMRINFT